jgi:hypothetical protein
MSLRIGDEDWRFEAIGGEQIVRDDERVSFEVLAHCHHDRHVVTICSALPLDRQHELAAKAALEIFRLGYGIIPFIGPTETSGPNDAFL